MTRIVELPAGDTVDWTVLDRSFTVERELRLHLVNGLICHEEVPVTPYEKTYPSGHEPLEDGVSFVAYVGDRIAAQIDLSRGWNGYAHIEDVIVARAFRRQGLARALVERAIEWAESERLPGVMLETQNNNVSACRLYESCGFTLQGFDLSLYRGLDPASREVALFWYRQTQRAAAISPAATCHATPSEPSCAKAPCRQR